MITEIYILAATLCTGVTANLISAVCDSTGFTIIVDETCRSGSYTWIDWASTFANGVDTVKEMPKSNPTECSADGTGTDWKFIVGFTECGIVAPTLSVADENGIKWYTYGVYINYDNDIGTAQGNGHLQQLDQTLVECRIPSTLVKKAVVGNITFYNNDLVLDHTSEVDLWDELQVHVQPKSSAKTASFTVLTGVLVCALH